VIFKTFEYSENQAQVVLVNWMYLLD